AARTGSTIKPRGEERSDAWDNRRYDVPPGHGGVALGLPPHSMTPGVSWSAPAKQRAAALWTEALCHAKDAAKAMPCLASQAFFATSTQFTTFHHAFM